MVWHKKKNKVYSFMEMAVKITDSSLRPAPNFIFGSGRHSG